MKREVGFKNPSESGGCDWSLQATLHGPVPDVTSLYRQPPRGYLRHWTCLMVWDDVPSIPRANILSYCLAGSLCCFKMSSFYLYVWIVFRAGECLHYFLLKLPQILVNFIAILLSCYFFSFICYL